MAFRKLIPIDLNCDLPDPINDEKIQLLKRAKNVLTSTRLKKEYDKRRASKMRSAIAEQREQRASITSYNQWMK